jgi:hypothetical protein
MVSAGQGGDGSLIRTGAHKVTIDPSSTIKVAGYTVGNLTLGWNTQKRSVYVAEWGQTPIDEQVLGVQVELAFSMIERSLKIFDIALNGLYPYTGVTSARGIGRSGIQTAQDRGKAILLHPLKEGSSTRRDITLRKVLLSPTGSIELSDQDNQIWQVGGMCVVDDTQTDGTALLEIKEPTPGV